MAIQTQALHTDFGVSVTGIDLGRPLGAEQVAAVQQLIDDHSFVCFPDQHLSDDQQLAFTRHLGQPEPNHVILGQTGRTEYFGTIGNIGPNGEWRGNADKHVRFLTGNNMWHTDSSFRQVPSLVSIMSVHEVPEEGGETLFVSARAAHARLSDDEQAEIAPLVAIHDYVFSRSKVSPDAVTPSHAASLPPVRQKLVRRNPANGRPNFYIGSHAREIEDWGFDRSRPLLDGLLDRATAPEHVLTHRWQPGELVIWDNRCLLHRGVGYDADKYRRYMRQTRVTGAGPTVAEP